MGLFKDLATPFVGATKAATGTLFGGGGGETPQFPGLSPEEQTILKQQQDLLERFGPIFGDFAERAISGDLPISPQLEQSLMQQETLTREDIARRGGTGAAEFTTAGIQRLGRQEQGANIARETARQQAIPLAIGALGSLQGTRQSVLGTLGQQRLGQFQVSREQAAQEQANRQQLFQTIGGGAAGFVAGGPPGALLGATGQGGLIPFLGGNQQSGGGTQLRLGG